MAKKDDVKGNNRDACNTRSISRPLSTTVSSHNSPLNNVASRRTISSATSTSSSSSSVVRMRSSNSTLDRYDARTPNTQDEMARKEAFSKELQIKLETNSHTRDRLANIDGEIKRPEASITTSRTREASMYDRDGATSSKTRDELAGNNRDARGTRNISKPFPTSISNHNPPLNNVASGRTISSAASTSNSPSVVRMKLSDSTLDRDDATSSKTRYELARKEAYLRQLQMKAETSSHTRDRMAIIDEEIKMAEASRTTSRTREELRRKEERLRKLKEESTMSTESEVGSRTHDRLNMIDDEIKRMKASRATSSIRNELKIKEEELMSLKAKSCMGSETKNKLKDMDRAIAAEKRKEKEMQMSTERTFVAKEKELSTLKEVNARRQMIKLVMAKIAASQITDLAFLLDCTGSMDQYINAVKDEIQKVVDNVKKDHPDAALRIAFVGYRDHCDALRIEKMAFTNDLEVFRKFLTNVKANGGGDAAEDVFGGLREVGMLAWKSPCRVLMHFADAPCHGNRFHDGVLDDDSHYNTADRNGLRIENLLSKLQQTNVRYYFGQINSSTDKMVTVFRQVAGDINFPLMVNVSDTSTICSTISSSVSSSISTVVERETTCLYVMRPFERAFNFGSIAESETILRRPSRKLKSFRITKEDPNWDRIYPRTGKSITAKLPGSFENLKEKLEITCAKRVLKIAAQPFSQGSQRIAYKGLDCSLSEPKEKVLKTFKYTGDTYKDYLAILETHVIAAFLAKEFYKEYSAQKITYLSVFINKFTEEGGIQKIYTSETLFPDYEVGFQKWTNNTSFVKKEVNFDVINAFSHWSYEKTSGYLMVCDLQGIQVNLDHFVLTDPAMHCTDLLRFGSTNLGPDGMKKFFRTHECNNVCRRLSLRKGH